MRRTVHAAAAAAAAATLDMEAVQRSLAAAAWRQGDMRAQLQGVIEEEDEEGNGTSSQTQQQEQHPWGGTPPGPGCVAQRSCLVRAVFGSYSHRGLMHDNEDRVSVAAWGHDPPAPAARQREQQQQHQCPSPSPTTAEHNYPRSSSPGSGPGCSSRPESSVCLKRSEQSILELAAGGRGLGYEWHQADPPPAESSTLSAATAAEAVSCFGLKCDLPPPVGGVRVAVQGRFAADAAAMQEAAAAAATDAAPSGAAAIDAAIEYLVDGPPAVPWSAAASAAAAEHQAQQGRWGPLSVLRRRRHRRTEVEGTAVSLCWEHPSLLPMGPSGATGSPDVYTLQKPVEAAKRDNTLPSVFFLICDGHDTHEASSFVSKSLPLLAFRRLPHQLPLLPAEQLHAAGKNLFADLDALMRRRCAVLRKQSAEGAASGSCLVAALLQGPYLITFNMGDSGAAFISFDFRVAAARALASKQKPRAGAGGVADPSAGAASAAAAAVTGGSFAAPLGSAPALNDLLVQQQQQQQPQDQQQQQQQPEEEASVVGNIGVWDYKEFAFRPLPGGQSNPGAVGTLSDLLLQQQNSNEGITNIPSSSVLQPRRGHTDGSSSHMHLSRSAPALRQQHQQRQHQQGSSTLRRERSFFGLQNLDASMAPSRRLLDVPSPPCLLQLQQKQQQQQAGVTELRLPLDRRAPPVAAAGGMGPPRSSAAELLSAISSSSSISSQCSSRVSLSLTPSSSRMPHVDSTSSVAASSTSGGGGSTSSIRFQWLSRQLRCGCPSEDKRIRALGVSIINNKLGGIIEPTRSIGDFDVKDRLPPRALSIEPEIGVYSVASLFSGASSASVFPGTTFVASAVSPNCGLLLLATDGVWDFVGSADVLRCIQQIKPLWRAIEAAAKRETEVLQHQQQKQQGTVLGRQVASASDISSLIRSSLGGSGNSSNKLQGQPLLMQMQQQQHHPSSVPSGLKRISSWRRLLPSQGAAATIPRNTSVNGNAIAAAAGGGCHPPAFCPSQIGPQQHHQQAQHESPQGPLLSPRGALFEAPTPQMMSELCRLIVKKAIKKGSTDDCTCLAAFIYPVAPRASTMARDSEGFWSSIS